MSDQWFCYVGDREYGPFTTPQLRELVAQGRLTAEHLVRLSSNDPWLPAGQVPGLFPVPPTPVGIQGVPLARPASGSSVGAAHPRWPAPARVPMTPPGTTAAPGLPVGVPLTSGLPVGTAVAAPGNASYPVAVLAGAHRISLNSERSELRRKRAKAKAQQLLLTVGLLGAGLLLLGILIVVSVLNSKPVRDPRGRSTVPVAAAKKPKAQPSVESNPSNTAFRGVDPATLKCVDLAAMTSWLDASKLSGGGVRNVARILFSKAWRDADGSSRPCLKVELRIQNTSADTLNVQPWHAETQPTDPFAAIAIDDDNQPLAPGTGGRGSVPRRLRPNETVTEQLAFAMPPGGSAVRLVVPFSVFGQNGQLGFKIPPAVIKDLAPKQSIKGMDLGKPLGTDEPEPVLDLTVDGQFPAGTPPESQPSLPEIPNLEEPEVPAEENAGGGKVDEDSQGVRRP